MTVNFSKVLKADVDPVFFCEDGYFCDTHLRDVQAEFIQEFYQGGFSEGIICAGMRSGKTATGNFILAYESFKLINLDDPVRYYNLIPGSQIFLLGASYSEDQAKDNILQPIDGMMTGSEYFNEFRHKTTGMVISFPDKHVKFRIGGINTPGMIGRTSRAVLLDEMSKYSDTQGRTSGRMVVDNLIKSTGTLEPDSKVIIESSPMFEKDLIFERVGEIRKNGTEIYSFTDEHVNYKFGKWYMGKRLMYHYPTWVMNPNKTWESVREDFDIDYQGAMRDWAAIPTTGLRPFFGNQDILAVDKTKMNVLEQIFYEQDFKLDWYDYVLAGDPSAMQHTSYGLALGHREDMGENIGYILDGLWRFSAVPEVDPNDVHKFIMKVAELVPISSAVFDIWMYPRTHKDLANLGIEVQNHIVRLPDYERGRSAFYDKRLEICNYPFVISELMKVELKSETKVTCPRTATKDVADAMMNVIWKLSDEGQEESSKSKVKGYQPAHMSVI